MGGAHTSIEFNKVISFVWHRGIKHSVCEKVENIHLGMQTQGKKTKKTMHFLHFSLQIHFAKTTSKMLLIEDEKH